MKRILLSVLIGALSVAIAAVFFAGEQMLFASLIIAGVASFIIETFEG